jgi:glutamate synthase (NADPH/NADH) small chain
MGKPTGFVEWQRVVPHKRPAAERVRDHREIDGTFTVEQARQQAGRCMDCGVPFCMQGCPLGNPIPDFDDLVYRDRWRAAWLALAATNDLPEMTGRLCPAPCEAACTLAIHGPPVAIEQIEKHVTERAFAEGWVSKTVAAPTGRRVAVAGSGPAGLAAAAQLARAGHEVTVYERDDRIGGLLRYGIPDFKLEKWVIDRRLELLRAMGITFVTGAHVGRAPRWDALRAEHDAVLVAVGSRRPRDLAVPGRDLPGVVPAMDYLEQENRRVAGEATLGVTAAGKRVVVLGGGDTGSDCLGTAHRQGAAHAIQIELLPQPPETRAPENPWPQWPVVFRTSSSQEEGGDRRWALSTKRLEGDGRLECLVAVPVAIAGGELRELPGEERIAVDLLVLALGFVGPDATTLVDQLGVALDARGNVATKGHATSVPGVFAAGDARRGQSLVVWAIAEGREAAREIDAFLRQRPSILASRGRDAAFGGR